MKIAQKLLAILLLNALIPLFAAGIFYYQNTQQTLRDQIQHEIKNVSEHHIAAINVVLDRIGIRLNNFSHKAQSRILLDEYNKSKNPEVQKQLNTLLQEYLKDDPTFKQIHLLNNAGEVVASTDESFMGYDFSHAEVFKVDRNNPNMSIFFKDKEANLRQYLISPLKIDNIVVGYAVIEANVDELLLITGDYSELGNTGESYLVLKTNSGKLQYITPFRFKTDQVLSFLKSDPGSSIDYRGHPIISFVQQPQLKDWYLVTKIDTAEVDAPLIKLRNLSIFLLLITTIISIISAWYLARFTTGPLKRFTEVVKRIRGGDLNQKVQVESNDEIGLLATSFNAMTENLKQNIGQLRDERIKLEASINSLSVGYIMVDRNLTILTINHTARQTFCASKHSPFTILEECTFVHIEEELKGAVDLRAIIERCFNEKRALMVREVSFNNRFLKVIVTPIITIGVMGAVVLVDDITEAKIIERSRDEFFSIASHELRTPLTAIKGNTSLIEQYYSEKLKDPELAEMVKDIHESSVRLIGIVNDFLDMSRLEQGKMQFKKEPIDVISLITSVIKEYQVTGSQKKIGFEFINPQNTQLTASMPKAFADLNKVKQILINLIGNSLKFTDQGKITISIQLLPNFIKLLVTDTGRGISPVNQNLLFRKFQQANTSLLTRDTTKGTGLGLYISRLISQGMGGTIKLESSIEGKGSTFSLMLPIATTQQITNTLPQNLTIQTDTATGLTTHKG